MMRGVALAGRPAFRGLRSTSATMLAPGRCIAAARVHQAFLGKTASMATVSSLGIDKATGITKPVRAERHATGCGG